MTRVLTVSVQSFTIYTILCIHCFYSVYLLQINTGKCVSQPVLTVVKCVVDVPVILLQMLDNVVYVLRIAGIFIL